MITSQFIVTALLAISGVLALSPNAAISDLEARSNNVASCKGKLIKYKLHDFCKADLALYKKNSCTFKSNRIGHITLPSSISQYAQNTVLQACADFLKVPVPTCAPVVTTPTGIKNACFSKTATLNSDPNQLGLCQYCSCKYVTGVTSDTSITNPMAIQCTYTFTRGSDYFRLNPLIDFSGQSDSSYPFRFQAISALGGMGPSGEASHKLNDAYRYLFTKDSCTSTSDCSIYVGSQGQTAAAAIESTAYGGYNGGGDSQGGGGGGGASTIVMGSVQPSIDSDNILLIVGGGGGSSRDPSDGSPQGLYTGGTALQGAMGTNGGGAGGGGYYGGVGAHESDAEGGAGSSRPSSRSAETSPTPFDAPDTTDNGNGIVYISLGCVGVIPADTGCAPNCYQP